MFCMENFKNRVTGVFGAHVCGMCGEGGGLVGYIDKGAHLNALCKGRTHKTQRNKLLKNISMAQI